MLQHCPLPHVPSFGPPHALEQLPPEQVGVELAQPWHPPPLLPHAALASPGWQLEPSQHPPLHVSPPAHEVEHTCVELQAWPVGQSA